jgi:catechol 2,3-dioxygenase-like lactoylglutathione lyase family enzyme
MPHTTGKRYAVVSCHVERPLDDEIWSRFSALQERRPGGFAIAALMRPADTSAGEDERRWVERAREAAVRGPLGHHTHWTAPDHARPTDDRTGARVLAEGNRLRELGLAPTLFCGGGWYTDPEVAEACARLGYVDCTPRATRPPYLGSGEAWASLPAPAGVRLASGRTLRAIPTTHSLGTLARAVVPPRSLPHVVHVYFHDTDLVDRRRRLALAAVLGVLGRRAQPTDLEALAASMGEAAPEIPWADVARL